MTTKIDFPLNPTQDELPFVSTDKAGNATVWDRINGSWVKRYDYVTDIPVLPADTEYVRKNLAWFELQHPVPSDVSAEPGNALGDSYVRQDDAWSLVALGSVGFPDAVADGVLYGRRDGNWDVLSATDFAGDVYSKAETDALLDAKTSTGHAHMLVDISDAGAMASVADAPIDSKQYARVDNTWVQVALPVVNGVPKSITIIDPISTDDAIIFFTPTAITLQQVRAASLTAGTSTSFNILFASTADGSGGNIGSVFIADQTANSSTGSEHVPDVYNIPANSWIWCSIVGDPNNVAMFHLTITHVDT